MYHVSQYFNPIGYQSRVFEDNSFKNTFKYITISLALLFLQQDLTPFTNDPDQRNCFNHSFPQILNNSPGRSRLIMPHKWQIEVRIAHELVKHNLRCAFKIRQYTWHRISIHIFRYYPYPDPQPFFLCNEQRFLKKLHIGTFIQLTRLIAKPC